MNVSALSAADEIAVRSLAHSYAYALDFNDIELLKSIFAPDATWEFAGWPQTKQLDDILKIPGRLRGSFVKTHHAIQTQHVVLKGDEGSGMTYCMAYHVFRKDNFDAGRDVISIAHNYLIRYEDKFAKRGDAWVFTWRRLNVIARRVEHVLEQEVSPV